MARFKSMSFGGAAILYTGRDPVGSFDNGCIGPLFSRADQRMGY